MFLSLRITIGRETRFKGCLYFNGDLMIHVKLEMSHSSVSEPRRE